MNRPTLLLLVLALGLTACGGGGDGGGTADVTEIAATIDAAGSALSQTLLFRADPFADYDEPIATAGRAGEALDELQGELPSADAVGSEVAASYETMLARLETWRAIADTVAADLDAARDELEPVMQEWAGVEFGDEQPPAEFLEVVDRFSQVYDQLYDAGDEFGDACAEFSEAAGVAIDCYAFRGAPPPGEGEPED